jgi:hypothetical protein
MRRALAPVRIDATTHTVPCNKDRHELNRGVGVRTGYPILSWNFLGSRVSVCVVKTNVTLLSQKKLTDEKDCARQGFGCFTTHALNN